jgi:citrate/tricarballylate utilization protein
MTVNIPLTELHEESRRVFEICNACRYCEGFCAVFQEMVKHRTFSDTKLDHLSNLCHNCTACYHACQYKPPHEFAINLPATLAAIRPLTWQAYAWPRRFAALLDQRGLWVTLVLATLLSLFLMLSFVLLDDSALSHSHLGEGAFYKVIAHSTIVVLAGGSLLWALLAILRSAKNFIPAGPFFSASALRATIADISVLRHLGGGHGEGCNDQDEQFSNARRGFHHAAMYGFALCFAATCTATFYELILGRMSPFPYDSLPVLLGITGGVGLIVGPAGLCYLHLRAHPETKSLLGMDIAFSVLLMLISLSGFALMLLRETQAMGWLLAIHLGIVLVFFITMPYTKMMHAIYRTLALIGFHRTN